MIRMLIVGHVFAIRSERALCREVQVKNFAYRWFCGLSIEDKIPDHSVFSRARNERFGDSAIFRSVFERVVGACIAAGLVGGKQLRYLPSYSPDFNPIEQFFAKFKTLLRKAAARTIDALFVAIADALAKVSPQECRNYLANQGYRYKL